MLYAITAIGLDGKEYAFYAEAETFDDIENMANQLCINLVPGGYGPIISRCDASIDDILEAQRQKKH